MPDKNGQLLPGEKEEGLEEGDLSDYIMPLKAAGKGLIRKLIGKGMSGAVKGVARSAKKKLSPDMAREHDQAKMNEHYSKTRYDTKKVKLTDMSPPSDSKPEWEDL